MTIQQAVELAFHHQQTGRLEEAEAVYRQILLAEPREFDALHLRGMLAHQTGRELAADLVGRAVAIRPEDAMGRSNLSDILRILGRPDEAVAAGREANPGDCRRQGGHQLP